MRWIAQRLIVAETGAAHASTAVFPVNRRLHANLAMLVGHGGAVALLARALVLARNDVAWLEAAHVNADGDLGGMDTVRADLDPDKFLEGRVALLAQVLGLLVAFIGSGLTSRMLGEIWPQVPFGDRDFGEEYGIEKAG